MSHLSAALKPLPRWLGRQKSKIRWESALCSDKTGPARPAPDDWVACPVASGLLDLSGRCRRRIDTCRKRSEDHARAGTAHATYPQHAARMQPNLVVSPCSIKGGPVALEKGSRTARTDTRGELDSSESENPQERVCAPGTMYPVCCSSNPDKQDVGYYASAARTWVNRVCVLESCLFDPTDTAPSPLMKKGVLKISGVGGPGTDTPHVL